MASTTLHHVFLVYQALYKWISQILKLFSKVKTKKKNKKNFLKYIPKVLGKPCLVEISISTIISIVTLLTLDIIRKHAHWSS